MLKETSKTGRHKCHICGAVRYEEHMEKMKVSTREVETWFGNDRKLWKCRGKCWRRESDKNYGT
jgi:hypothetical protein